MLSLTCPGSPGWQQQVGVQCSQSVGYLGFRVSDFVRCQGFSVQRLSQQLCTWYHTWN